MSDDTVPKSVTKVCAFEIRAPIAVARAVLPFAEAVASRVWAVEIRALIFDTAVEIRACLVAAVAQLNDDGNAPALATASIRATAAAARG